MAKSLVAITCRLNQRLLETIREGFCASKTKPVSKENGGACWLYQKHTVFGQVVEGYDVLDKIAAVEVDSSSKPNEDVIIESIDFDVY